MLDSVADSSCCEGCVCEFYKVLQQQYLLLSLELLMWKTVAATAEDFNKFVINMSQISLVDSQA